MRSVGLAASAGADLVTKDELDAAVAGAGGSGGSLNTAAVQLDFGHAVSGSETTALTTVSAAWATTTSPALVVVAGTDSPDHTAEETLLDQVRAVVVSRTAGVGFDVQAYAPAGTWGRHNFVAMG